MKPRPSSPSGVSPLLAATLFLFAAPLLAAEPPVTLENHVPPAANVADEPFIKEFSYERAVRFADRAAMDWQASHGCITCHTNGLYLAARPAAGLDSPAYREARSFATNYLKGHVQPAEDKKRPRGGTEAVVAATALLAISDMKTNGKLGEITKASLEHIWKIQDESGAWNKWAKCHWGPYEVDDHFGVTLVALALGIAGKDDYTQSPAAVGGAEKLRKYLKENPPTSLHQIGMMLWASSHFPDLADPSTQNEWKEKIFQAQKEDGGWVLPELGNADWKRADDKPQSKESDAYATAFSIHVLSEAGVPREDPRLAKARHWLRKNQRASGRWHTRSPHVDRKHYISHAATNFALLALAPPAE